MKHATVYITRSVFGGFSYSVSYNAPGITIYTEFYGNNGEAAIAFLRSYHLNSINVQILRGLTITTELEHEITTFAALCHATLSQE